MVTITLAKSLETGQIVTTAEADRQRELGNIKSKYLFECIDDHCDAQITCANLLKEVKKRKKDPYFIYVGDHDKKCKEKEKIEILEREQQERHDSKPRKYVSEKVALFNFDKPSTKKTETTTRGASPLTEPTSNEGTTNGQSQSGVRPSKKALSSWVKLFNDDADISVIYNDEEIHIRDLFVDLDKVTDIADLDEEPKIYYGKAWINPKENIGIQLAFHQKIKLDDLVQQPSLMLFNNKIKDEAINGKFSDKTLKKLSERRNKNDKKVPITLYIFSQLPPQLTKDGKFINFYAKELTYIYYEK
ncbi:hypothetical protein [Acinetobacter sp. FDAARGOS_515]|uniref:hypothetical protein n=1 Tax=Acinetobacter sp. FDAARGOS_515 TaxID=2420307 RepID=UPI000F6610B5|nr:hypothetical protein [Acinetobacter sp. FDAARGOS_515]RSC23029.1 hypothetical protein EGS47_09865 [Acinetobacter sp. FDAARGOS_515]